MCKRGYIYESYDTLFKSFYFSHRNNIDTSGTQHYHCLLVHCCVNLPNLNPVLLYISTRYFKSSSVNIQLLLILSGNPANMPPEMLKIYQAWSTNWIRQQLGLSLVYQPTFLHLLNVRVCHNYITQIIEAIWCPNYFQHKIFKHFKVQAEVCVTGSNMSNKAHLLYYLTAKQKLIYIPFHSASHNIFFNLHPASTFPWFSGQFVKVHSKAEFWDDQILLLLI